MSAVALFLNLENNLAIDARFFAAVAAHDRFVAIKLGVVDAYIDIQQFQQLRNKLNALAEAHPELAKPAELPAAVEPPIYQAITGEEFTGRGEDGDGAAPGEADEEVLF